VIGKKEGAFYRIGIIVITTMFGIFSPVGALICAFVGLVMIYFLGLTSVITVGSLIIFAAMAILIGFKLKS
jgi:membrane protein YqaA with SNARE-associated domain